ncbi:hypothetical protein EV07_0018 [Prochlorococcus sp. MIT 0603]|nr:hypothetical protein EV07_0018 [Prochlorococcus sp. MIT 0603]
MYFSQIEANSCGLSGTNKIAIAKKQMAIPKINWNLFCSSIPKVL